MNNKMINLAEYKELIDNLSTSTEDNIKEEFAPRLKHIFAAHDVCENAALELTAVFVELFQAAYQAGINDLVSTINFGVTNIVREAWRQHK